eukprot:300024_1
MTNNNGGRIAYASSTAAQLLGLGSPRDSMPRSPQMNHPISLKFSSNKQPLFPRRSHTLSNANKQPLFPNRSHTLANMHLLNNTNKPNVNNRLSLRPHSSDEFNSNSNHMNVIRSNSHHNNNNLNVIHSNNHRNIMHSNSNNDRVNMHPISLPATPNYPTTNRSNTQFHPIKHRINNKNNRNNLIHPQSAHISHSTPIKAIHNIDNDNINNNRVIRSASITNNNMHTLQNISNPVDTTSNIRVVVRIRPLNNQEQRDNCSYCIKLTSDENPNSIIVQQFNKKTNTIKKEKQFSFDKIFHINAEQSQFFDLCGIKKLVDASLNGYATTIFAYGQTGSGKTYTICGENNNNNEIISNKCGVIPRTIVYFWNKING